MPDAFICDAVRTPIGKFGGSLSSIRTDDLAAIPIKALMERNQSVDWEAVDDVILGCTNQAGEDNRNVARMASLLAGLPIEVPGVTVNRLCASGMEAIVSAARAIKLGDDDLIVAGGVESMSRAPLVVGKAESAFDRGQQMFDTSIGWRFANPKMEKMYGTDSMPETAENLAVEHNITREDQDSFAHWSQTKATAAIASGSLINEIVPVEIPQRKADPIIFDTDEHPRLSSLETLAKLKAPFRENGTITAGNASGINDGAAAVIVASEDAVKKYGLTARARVVASAVAGVPPRTMGIGPVPATQKLLERAGMKLDQFDIIEINEAFAAQVLACTRSLGIADDDPRINPLGGAIALGHPLGMSGARLAITAVNQLNATNKSHALCTMCVGVGQGMAVLLSRNA